MQVAVLLAVLAQSSILSPTYHPSSLIVRNENGQNGQPIITLHPSPAYIIQSVTSHLRALTQFITGETERCSTWYRPSPKCASHSSDSSVRFMHLWIARAYSSSLVGRSQTLTNQLPMTLDDEEVCFCKTRMGVSLSTVERWNVETCRIPQLHGVRTEALVKLEC